MAMLVLAAGNTGALPYEPFLQLVLAVVLGGLVGLEREFHGRPAGLRTHILVCLGATLAMVATVHFYQAAPRDAAGSPLRIDPGRIAAGVLTGIGFIGAGAIIRLRGTNRGLTTAACIWLVASIGVVLGMGAYAAAVGTTVLAIFVLLVLHELERFISPVTYRELIVLADLEESLAERVRKTVQDVGAGAFGGEFEEDLEAGQTRIRYSVRYRGTEVGQMLERRIRELPGVRSITWRLVGGENG
jgi:putative Mg2+ transporter-C (MgtC) family protein